MRARALLMWASVWLASSLPACGNVCEDLQEICDRCIDPNQKLSCENAVDQGTDEACQDGIDAFTNICP